MSTVHDEDYFVWLVGEFIEAKPRPKYRTYWQLLRRLYSTPFVWVIPNDDNRLMEGLEVRREYTRKNGSLTNDPSCSVLEVLIALSRRLSFDSEGEPAWWFWHMLKNLELAVSHDDLYFENEVEEIIEVLMFRSYHPNGQGGLFPLKHAKEDQRKVELLYQSQAYILEGNYRK